MGTRRLSAAASVLVSRRRGEPRRLELLLGDQPAIGFVDGDGEQRRGQELEVQAPVDAGPADEGHGLAHPLDHRGEKEIAAKLDQIRA